MKKLLSVVFSLLFLLSLCILPGCQSGQDESSGTPSGQETGSGTGQSQETQPPAEGSGTETEITQQMLEESKPCEYIQEKLDAGMEVSVAFSGGRDNFFVSSILSTGVQGVLEDLGFNWIYINANGDIALQITQLENFVQMGIAAIVIQTIDAEAICDTVLAAQEAGTKCILYGVTPSYDTIVVRTDVYECGVQTANMALAWVSQRYPNAGEGEIHAAVFGSAVGVDQIAKTDGMKDTLNADPRITLSYVDDEVGNIDEAYTSMEAAMMYDPDIRLLVCYSLAGAYGGNNYVLTLPDADLGEFGMFASGTDDITTQMLEEAAAGQGCFRGTILDGENPFIDLANTTVAALFGEIEAPYFFWQPLFSQVSSDLNYSYDSRTA